MNPLFYLLAALGAAALVRCWMKVDSAPDPAGVLPPQPVRPPRDFVYLGFLPDEASGFSCKGYLIGHGGKLTKKFVTPHYPGLWYQKRSDN